MDKAKQIAKRMTEKDISRRAFWVLAALVVLVRVVLALHQQVYAWVGGAPLDDELMYKAAQSIAAGQWLGEYNYLTLSKQMFFAVWLAFCHALHLPYLVAGQLLMCGASLAAAQAFAPVLRQYKARLLLFAALACSPAAGASFTLRVYRDNIFPALCLLLFAGVIGAALRYKQGLHRYWLWLALAGAGLGLAAITREDGIWLLPFALAGLGITAVFILRQKELDKKPARCAALLAPFGLMAACILAMSAMNYAWYGVFTTSDFSSGSFADAYGAMTRIAHENDDPLVPVPKDVREKLYEAVPELEPLRYWLEESPALQNAYQNKEIGDYQAGAFYWVLRRAAQETGVYSDAATAAAYWATVADKINTAIADGTLTAAYRPRSGTTPVLRSIYVLPTLQEMGRSFWYCLTFQDCACYYADAAGLSLITPEDAAQYAAYLGSTPNYAAQAGTDVPYYSARQQLVYGAFEVLRWGYALLGPVLVALALALQCRAGWQMLRQKRADGLLLWLVLLGVLGMALLRCAMIAFMEVAAFQIGTYVMYLASVHPPLIVYGVVGTMTGWPVRTGRGAVQAAQKEGEEH